MQYAYPIEKFQNEDEKVMKAIINYAKHNKKNKDEVTLDEVKKSKEGLNGWAYRDLYVNKDDDEDDEEEDDDEFESIL